MLSWLINDLLRVLKQTEPRDFTTVVMPDFFIDRFVTFPGDLEEFSTAMADVAERKGGNIHGIKQVELRGGNAANTTAALASLGAKACPIITTDALGLHLLKFYLHPLGVDLSHVKCDGQVSLTTALELSYKGEKVNIMMGDLGSLPTFSPKNLTERDLSLLREADYVGVFNWAATYRFGTSLAETVFRYVKEEGKAKTYFDSGDPAPNLKNIPKLLRNVLQTHLLDVFSVNENEALQYARRLDNKVKHSKRKLDHYELAKECARILSKHLTARVDLHTTAFSGSFTRDDEIIVPAFRVKGLRSTGAGDAWNAGNIYGDALQLPDSCRLTLANAVAAYYVSSSIAEHPTLPELVKFCQNQRH